MKSTNAPTDASELPSSLRPDADAAVEADAALPDAATTTNGDAGLDGGATSAECLSALTLRPRSTALDCEVVSRAESYVTELDADGTAAITLASDQCNNTYVAVRSSNGIWVNKVSADGSLVWTSALIAEADASVVLTVTHDGDPLIAVTSGLHSNNDATFPRYATFVQLDPASGYARWQAVCGGNDDIVVTDLVATPSGFTVAGTAVALPWHDHDVEAPFVTAFDDEGVASWSYRPEEERDALRGVKLTSSGLVAAVATRLVRLGADGEMTSSVDLGVQGAESIVGLTAASRGDDVYVLGKDVDGEAVAYRVTGDDVVASTYYLSSEPMRIAAAPDGLDVVALVRDAALTVEVRLHPRGGFVGLATHASEEGPADTALTPTEVLFLSDGRYVAAGTATDANDVQTWYLDMTALDGTSPTVAFDEYCYTNQDLCELPVEFDFPALSSDASTVVARAFNDDSDSQFQFIDVASGEAIEAAYYANDASTAAYEQWAAEGFTTVFSDIAERVEAVKARLESDEYAGLVPEQRLGLVSRFDADAQLVTLRCDPALAWCVEPELDVEVAFNPDALATDTCVTSVAATQAWLAPAARVIAVEVSLLSDESCSYAPRWLIASY